MAHSGILHRYNKKLVAFEHTSPPDQPHRPNPHLILWIGGLGDGLLSPSYPATIARRLPLEWRLVEVLLTSSYQGWATGSLARDAKELAQCVKYFKDNQKPHVKIVLMGHSTGCQDIMEYLVGKRRQESPRIQGAILQAGISDREGIADIFSSELYESSVKLAKQWVSEGHGKDVLPIETTQKVFGSSPSAERWLSLVEKNGADDYFSSDLTNDQLSGTFGQIGPQTPMMFLLSGDDEHMPEFVDKVALVARWTQAVRRGGGIVDDKNGGVVPGAYHNYEKNEETVVSEMVSRVLGFLSKVSGDFVGTKAYL